jgi:hypothetical protein
MLDQFPSIAKKSNATEHVDKRVKEKKLRDWKWQERCLDKLFTLVFLREELWSLGVGDNELDVCILKADRTRSSVLYVRTFFSVLNYLADLLVLKLYVGTTRTTYTPSYRWHSIAKPLSRSLISRRLRYVTTVLVQVPLHIAYFVCSLF